eukprot:7445028-Pyramimonas_sp.AAC.1
MSGQQVDERYSSAPPGGAASAPSWRTRTRAIPRHWPAIGPTRTVRRLRQGRSPCGRPFL